MISKYNFRTVLKIDKLYFGALFLGAFLAFNIPEFCSLFSRNIDINNDGIVDVKREDRTIELFINNNWGTLSEHYRNGALLLVPPYLTPEKHYRTSFDKDPDLETTITESNGVIHIKNTYDSWSLYE